MNRRDFVKMALCGSSALIAGKLFSADSGFAADKVEKLNRTNAQWKQKLNPAQYLILRQEGTEKPFSSALCAEKRSGNYACAACGLPLFPSKFKYDSGMGWPSFFDTIPAHIETKSDYMIMIPRTEYHCACCGGHQGHIFMDGPRPTGLRYRNNGTALTFTPDSGIIQKEAP